MLFSDLSSERIVRALKKAGFRVIHEGKHIGLSDGTRRVTVPRHARVNPFTLKAVIRDAGLTDREFKELL
ncbi:MAG: type II toxin-antitoxin system HicA family toxin [Elusimicrobia bacterium]|nr:type II toxin-antitoxin system HicA family toxin [Elusimicrobiota bacterium]